MLISRKKLKTLIEKYIVFFQKTINNEELNHAYENILNDLLSLQYKEFKDYNIDIKTINLPKGNKK